MLKVVVNKEITVEYKDDYEDSNVVFNYESKSGDLTIIDKNSGRTIYICGISTGDLSTILNALTKG